MTKNELRKVYQAKRSALALEEALQKSERIKARFFGEVFSDRFKTLHIFLPIKKNKEIDTWLIIESLRTRKSGVKIVVSKTDMARRKMVNYYYDPAARLVENKWGIPEPAAGALCDNLHIDAALIPLLAFDKSGHRVGYGQGFYDRFLAACRADALKIGLSYEPPVDRIDDVHAHDVRLDIAVTPEKVYYF